LVALVLVALALVALVLAALALVALVLVALVLVALVLAALVWVVRVLEAVVLVATALVVLASTAPALVVQAWVQSLECTGLTSSHQQVQDRLQQLPGTRSQTRSTYPSPRCTKQPMRYTSTADRRTWTQCTRTHLSLALALVALASVELA
jgi:hypothetical protein